MLSKLNWLLLFLFIFCPKNFSQTNGPKEQIVEKLNNYFALERENIHLHLNKDTYLSEEDIWFKGYAYNRKELLPFYKTMNVFVVLYNQAGIKINQQLAYSNTGTFEGAFKDLKKLPSGNYYIQVYTNWMNNFQENESSIYPIKIINPAKTDFFDTTKSNLASAQIEIHPEGGTLVYGITNTVGVKIVDMFNNPIGNLTAKLRNSINEVVSEIAINSDGLGKFIVTPKNDPYSLTLEINNKIIQQTLPNPSTKGLSLEVNCYTLNNKASVKIKTNATTFNVLKSKQLFLVVQQDERALLFDIALDSNSLEQNIIFSTENISNGVNTVRIIDENMNQLAERTIIKLPNLTQKFTLSKKTTNTGTIQIEGLSSQNDANLSVSIVPANSIATEKNTSITSDFLSNFYLLKPIKNIDLYQTNPNTAKKYELDLAMLNQSKSKYSWNEIVQNPPQPNYEFDMGLTVKGRVLTPTLKNAKDYNIRFRAFHHQINVQSPITETGDFEFKYLVLKDSASVDFSLLKNVEATPLKLTHTAKITNGNREYKFPFKGFNPTDLQQTTNSQILELPVFEDDIIELNTVTVKAEAKKNMLTHANTMENRNLRGYKISEQETMNLLTFINTRGFKVSDNGMDVSITVLNSGSNIPARPEIFVDNIQIRDFSYLQNIQMNELEEIYMNPNALIPSGRNLQGIVRIYTKKPIYSTLKTNVKSSELANGFTTAPKFENSNYNSTLSQGFLYYGVINWIPTLLTDQKNSSQIDVPNFNQKKIKIIIEGFTYNGELISETQIIDL